MNATVMRAKGWADALVSREHKGPGDTLEAAMARASRKHGVAIGILWKLRYRPPSGIMADVYLRLQDAYRSECERQAARLRHELEITRRTLGDDVAPDLVREAEALVSAVDGGHA